MLAYAPTPYVTIHHDLIMLPFGLKKGNIVVTLQIKGNIAKVIHMYNKSGCTRRGTGTGLSMLGYVARNAAQGLVSKTTRNAAQGRVSKN